ncbi:MAG: hypothetical protein AAFX54_02930 [Pseudomonadota bacterium]
MLTIPALWCMMHEDVLREKEKPLAPGAIHNVTGALRSRAGYPQHWRMRIEQAKGEKETRKEVRKK